MTELAGRPEVVAHCDESYNDAATAAESDPVAVTAGATMANVDAEYYNDAASAGAATQVPVPSTTAVTGVDAALALVP